jgi:EAL domain-containing protein (putative c-di-GMP-specific phosphodiesterase class I)
MQNAELEIGEIDRQLEDARLAALLSTEILDTASEPSYDAITRLAAECFHADAATIAFADESRVWMKSCHNQTVRELPRTNSIFDMVLRQDGPVNVPDVAQYPQSEVLAPRLRHVGMASFCSVPVRSSEGRILGILTVFRRAPGEILPTEALPMLESLAEMVSSQLELRKLRKASNGNGARRSRAAAAAKGSWPSRPDLRHALEKREFVLYYQPEVELSILPIGDWGLAEACNQIQKWCQEDARHSSLRVCVNLSARQFSREGLADHVEALLLQSGITSHQLGLEMTESSLIPNIDTALQVLSSLRKLGVSLLMDDFGTGYSSLNHLHSFPFDVLKIDRSFVGRMTEGEQPLQIVRTIIELARVLGMDVVAEGIETREQYRLLRQMGCRYGQGYLMARPMTAEAATRLLRLPGRILPEALVSPCA